MPENGLGHMLVLQRAVDARRTKAQYDQLISEFIQTFHPMGKTKNQLDLSWESLQWNPQIETIHQFVSKLKNLAGVLNKSQADQAYRLKKSLPADLRKIIMTCNSVDSIFDTINQMQAMNNLGLNAPLHLLQPQTFQLCHSWLHRVI